MRSKEPWETKIGSLAEIFIDNGSQLKGLKHTKFSVLDADLLLQDALGLHLTVSNAKRRRKEGLSTGLASSKTCSRSHRGRGHHQ